MNYCTICHQPIFSYPHACATGVGAPTQTYQPTPTPNHYHYAQDLCGGHCWCLEVKVKGVRHKKCCNCGLKDKN